MRRGLIALVAGLTACASVSAPPGGPEDKLAPKLVRISPDSNAVNVTANAVSFFFDETINDRGTGATAVDAYFLVSPSDGAPRVSWHRSRIDIRPRKGFRPNTAYTIALLPGLTDLRSNVMKVGAAIVFSTGPTIPADRITGIAFDWVAERPAANAYLEAVTPDSIVYLAQADSLGRFTIGPISPGSYLVRAIIDQNSNRGLDRGEAYDSARVTVPGATGVELLAAPRDTLPASILEVTSPDSVTLKVNFNRLLDPRQSFTVANFRLAGEDSVVIPIAAVLTPRMARSADSLAARQAADSSRRADSLAGKPLTPIIPLAPAVVRPGETPPPVPSIPSPFTAITLKVARPLPPNTPYRLTAGGVLALSGRTLPSERTFRTPRPLPAAPADSARTTPPPATIPPARPPLR